MRGKEQGSKDREECSVAKLRLGLGQLKSYRDALLVKKVGGC